MQHAGVDVTLLMQEAPGSPQQATLVLISKHLCTGTSIGQHQECEGGPAREEGASMEAAPGAAGPCSAVHATEGQEQALLTGSSECAAGFRSPGRAFAVLPAASQDSNAALTQSF